MQKWEYRVVYVDLDQNVWGDDAGQEGSLPKPTIAKGSKGSSRMVQPFAILLSELGEQAWELTGVENPNYSTSASRVTRLYFKRPKA